MGFAEALFELLAVLNQVDALLGYAAIHGGFCDGGGAPGEDAGIERFGDDVLAAEFEALDAVGAQDGIGHVFFGERGEGACGGQLHLIVNGGGAYIERAAEDEGEAEDVIDLVGVIGTASGDDGVGTGGLGHVVGNLGIGVGKGEDDGVRGHGLDHVGGDAIGGGKPEEDVGAHQRFGQGARGGG